LGHLIQTPPPLYKGYNIDIVPTVLNAESVPEDTYELDEINQYSSDIECLLSQQHTVSWNDDKYLEIFWCHILMKLEKQNMGKTSFELAAAESYGDVCQRSIL
jgi:hypothetical protein